MPPKKSLADQIADLESTAPTDYDPEDIAEPVHEHGHEQEQEDIGKAREHYISVGKSALRSKQFLLDDPRYAGKRANRKDLFSDDELEQQEDNESGEESDNVNEDDSSEEDNSDNDNGEEIAAWNGVGGEQDGELPAAEDSEEENSDDESSDNDEDYEDDEEGEQGDSAIKEQLQRIQEEEKEMISKMSQSAQSDIEKGKHVREQLSLWERFLESRIRIQKVVDIANQLPQHDTWPDFLAKEEGVEPVLDEAKSQLRETIDELIDLRTAMFGENDAIEFGDHSWNKRKRHLDDDDEYVDALWEDITAVNEIFLPYRNSTLEKWSNKVQVASSVRLNKKFKAFDQNIITQIDNVLADKDRLIRRTQLQRNEYKILGKEEKASEQVAQGQQDTTSKADRHLQNFDEEIFDDNDFYQQLLRELIEARMVDTDDPISSGMRWAARKTIEGQKKKKKSRVTLHSLRKSRTLKFDPHEKLQNFMAPVPAGTWHEEMIEELYSSLLGQRKNILDEATTTTTTA